MPPGRGVSRRPVVIVPASVRESKLVQSSATSELKEAPGPKGAEHAQGITEFKNDALSFLTRMAREYGDITQFRLGLERVFEVAHPDHIRYALVFGHHNYMKAHAYQSLKVFLGNALLTSEGEVHRRHRRMIQPIMHHQRMTAYAPVMAAFTARLRDQWVDGQTVDVNREMLKLALSIVGKCLFDVDFEESSTNELSDALSAAMHMFSRDAPARVQMMKPHIRDGMANLQRVIAELIGERRASGEDRGDLLSMLLRATDTEGNHGKLTDEEVFQHSLGLVVGGHETTGAALTWTWYLIAQNPDVEEKLVAEVDRVLGDQLPGPEDVARLDYTRMVFQEALRLYPSAWTVTRKALVDHAIDGYAIPKDSTVFVPQWVAHRDPRWFREPDRFLPERWLPGAQPDLPKFAYFPFGGGPRVCIGEPFAELEAPIIISTLIRRWSMRVLEGFVPEAEALTTLRFKDGLQMVVTDRRTRT